MLVFLCLCGSVEDSIFGYCLEEHRYSELWDLSEFEERLVALMCKIQHPVNEHAFIRNMVRKLNNSESLKREQQRLIYRLPHLFFFTVSDLSNNLAKKKPIINAHR